MEKNAEIPAESINHSELNEEIADTFDQLEAEAEEAESPEEVSEDTPVEEPEEDQLPDQEPAEEDSPELAAESEENQVDEKEEFVYDEPPPDRWPEELKDAYNAAPPEIRQLMLDRIYKPMQQTYTKSTMELAEMRKAVEPMLQDLQNYRGEFERQGMNPVEAFQRQMAWAAHLARVGPEQGLSDMAAAYGLQNGIQGQQAPEEEYLTPTERRLAAQLNDVQNNINQFLQGYGAQQQAQADAQLHDRANEVRSGLKEFISETVDGKPAHPHVEKVAPAVAELIRNGMVKRVDDYGQQRPVRDVIAQAYDMACRLDDSIGSAKTDTRQVQRAKAANRGVVTKVPLKAEEVDEGPITDTIESVWQDLSRRAG